MVSSLPRRIALASTAVALAAHALSTPPAVAEPTSVSETVPAGGTVTTGATVSPDSPVQLSLTTDTGGALTINTVDLAAGTARNSLGPDDHDVYFNPRFVIPPGGAHVSAASLLVDGALIPWSSQYHGPLFVEGPLLQVNETDQGVPGGSGPNTPTFTKLADGNYSVPLSVDELNADNAAGSSFSVDVGRPKFAGYDSFFGTGSMLASAYAASDVVAGRMYAFGMCTTFCTDKTTVTLSLADATRLHITNRVLASSALLGMTYAHSGHLPSTLNGQAVLKKAIAVQRALKPTCVSHRLANGWISTTCSGPVMRVLTATVRTVITGSVPGDQIVKTGTMKIRSS
jgi:hypothetical protein